MEHSQQETKKNWLDRYYKILMAIPIILTLLCLVYLGYFYSENNDFIIKDVSLSGGTTITLQADKVTISFEELGNALKQKYEDVSLRKLTDMRSGESIAYVIESSEEPENLKLDIESILGEKLTTENSSVEFTGPGLSSNFYNQLVKALFAAFILMSLVIFFLFGDSKKLKIDSAILTLVVIKLIFNMPFIDTLASIIIFCLFFYSLYLSKSKKGFILPILGALIFIIAFFLPYLTTAFLILLSISLLALYLIFSPPSIAVMFAAFSDIVIPLAIIDYFGIRLSAAGISAFLMLVGYSVDTDILLTTRALKNSEGHLNSRLYRAFKTGILMTITALFAVLPAFFIVTGLPDAFRQIFLILALGLGADIVNTWMTNIGIIKWYCNRKGIQ